MSDGGSYFDALGRMVMGKMLCGCSCYGCREDIHCRTRDDDFDCDQAWEAADG